MERDDLIWLAGLLEGEGCFGIHQRRGRRALADVRVQMTDEDVVRRAARLLGSNVCRQNPRSSQRLATYTARVTGKKATNIMRTLLPFMGERRTRKIEEVLAAVF